MSNDFERCGWKEICAYLRVQDVRTAKKKLKALGLRMEHRRPVLNVEAYRIASMQSNLARD